eukprot:GHVL01041124.1.p1 GENE.GHVL01041124.1~~GHVL01041124.1.p1  ORF type:complete len:2540 (+),score=632.27 GHVL01041124.1:433-8052(+)
MIIVNDLLEIYSIKHKEFNDIIYNIPKKKELYKNILMNNQNQSSPKILSINDKKNEEKFDKKNEEKFDKKNDKIKNEKNEERLSTAHIQLRAPRLYLRLISMLDNRLNEEFIDDNIYDYNIPINEWRNKIINRPYHCILAIISGELQFILNSTCYGHVSTMLMLSNLDIRDESSQREVEFSYLYNSHGEIPKTTKTKLRFHGPDIITKKEWSSFKTAKYYPALPESEKVLTSLKQRASRPSLRIWPTLTSSHMKIEYLLNIYTYQSLLNISIYKVHIIILWDFIHDLCMFLVPMMTILSSIYDIHEEILQVTTTKPPTTQFDPFEDLVNIPFTRIRITFDLHDFELWIPCGSQNVDETPQKKIKKGKNHNFWKIAQNRIKKRRNDLAPDGLVIRLNLYITANRIRDMLENDKNNNRTGQLMTRLRLNLQDVTAGFTALTGTYIDWESIQPRLLDQCTIYIDISLPEALICGSSSLQSVKRAASSCQPEVLYRHFHGAARAGPGIAIRVQIDPVVACIDTGGVVLIFCLMQILSKLAENVTEYLFPSNATVENSTTVTRLALPIQVSNEMNHELASRTTTTNSSNIGSSIYNASIYICIEIELASIEIVDFYNPSHPKLVKFDCEDLTIAFWRFGQSAQRGKISDDLTEMELAKSKSKLEVQTVPIHQGHISMVFSMDNLSRVSGSLVSAIEPVRFELKLYQLSDESLADINIYISWININCSLSLFDCFISLMQSEILTFEQQHIRYLRFRPVSQLQILTSERLEDIFLDRINKGRTCSNLKLVDVRQSNYTKWRRNNILDKSNNNIKNISSTYELMKKMTYLEWTELTSAFELGSALRDAFDDFIKAYALKSSTSVDKSDQGVRQVQKVSRNKKIGQRRPKGWDNILLELKQLCQPDENCLINSTGQGIYVKFALASSPFPPQWTYIGADKSHYLLPWDGEEETPSLEIGLQIGEFFYILTDIEVTKDFTEVREVQVEQIVKKVDSGCFGGTKDELVSDEFHKLPILITTRINKETQGLEVRISSVMYINNCTNDTLWVSLAQSPFIDPEKRVNRINIPTDPTFFQKCQFDRRISNTDFLAYNINLLNLKIENDIYNNKCIKIPNDKSLIWIPIYWLYGHIPLFNISLYDNKDVNKYNKQLVDEKSISCIWEYISKDPKDYVLTPIKLSLKRPMLSKDTDGSNFESDDGTKKDVTLIHEDQADLELSSSFVANYTSEEAAVSKKETVLFFEICLEYPLEVLNRMPKPITICRDPLPKTLTNGSQLIGSSPMSSLDQSITLDTACDEFFGTSPMSLRIAYTNRLSSKISLDYGNPLLLPEIELIHMNNLTSYLPPDIYNQKVEFPDEPIETEVMFISVRSSGEPQTNIFANPNIVTSNSLKRYRYGTKMISLLIFAPLWITNRLPVPLWIASTLSDYVVVKSNSRISLSSHFSISLRCGIVNETVKKPKRNARLKLKNSWLSPKMQCSTPGRVGTFRLPDPTSDRDYWISASITFNPRPFYMTRLLEICPRFVVVNQDSVNLFIREVDENSLLYVPSPAQPPLGSELPPGGVRSSGPMAEKEKTWIKEQWEWVFGDKYKHVQALHPVKFENDELKCQFCLSSKNNKIEQKKIISRKSIRKNSSKENILDIHDWSVPVSFSKPMIFKIRTCLDGTIEDVKVKKNNVLLKVFRNVVVDCRKWGEASFIYFSKCTQPEFCIRNESSNLVGIRQKGVDLIEYLPPGGTKKDPTSDCGWFDPLGDKRLQVCIGNEKEARWSASFLIPAVGDCIRADFGEEKHSSFRVAAQSSVRLWVSTLLKNETRLVVFSDFETGSLNVSEEVSMFTNFSFQFNFILNGIGIGVYDTTPTEMIYIAISKICIDILCNNMKSIKLSFNIGDFQIDNYCPNSYYPSLLIVDFKKGKKLKILKKKNTIILDDIFIKIDIYIDILNDFEVEAVVEYLNIESEPILVNADFAAILQLLAFVDDIGQLMHSKTSQDASKAGATEIKQIQLASVAARSFKNEEEYNEEHLWDVTMLDVWAKHLMYPQPNASMYQTAKKIFFLNMKIGRIMVIFNLRKAESKARLTRDSDLIRMASLISDKLPTISEAPIVFNEYTKDEFLGHPSDVVNDLLINHLTQFGTATIKNATNVLGSVDMICNCVNMYNWIREAFAELILGIQRTGSSSGISLCSGLSNCFMHLAAGFCDTISRFTGGWANCLTGFADNNGPNSIYPDFVRSRGLMDQPKNAVEGATVGLVTFFRNSFLSVANVCWKPVHGVFRMGGQDLGCGRRGYYLCSGLIEGALGGVFGPIASLCLCGQLTCTGFKNSLVAGNNPSHVRPKRVVTDTNLDVFSRYDPEISELSKLLLTDLSSHAPNVWEVSYKRKMHHKALITNAKRLMAVKRLPPPAQLRRTMLQGFSTRSSKKEEQKLHYVGCSRQMMFYCCAGKVKWAVDLKSITQLNLLQHNLRTNIILLEIHLKHIDSAGDFGNYDKNKTLSKWRTSVPDISQKKNPKKSKKEAAYWPKKASCDGAKVYIRVPGGERPAHILFDFISNLIKSYSNS